MNVVFKFKFDLCTVDAACFIDLISSKFGSILYSLTIYGSAACYRADTADLKYSGAGIG